MLIALNVVDYRYSSGRQVDCKAMVSTQIPLRKKRKAATRDSLISSARLLFAQRGYKETTLEEVAEHAGLHVQTLYRHFANKQELATAGDQDLLDQFEYAITDPQRSSNTFDFWREWVGDMAVRLTRVEGGQNLRVFLRQRWSRHRVSPLLIRIAQQYEDLLTESLARDFGLPSIGVATPRLVAIMLWGVHSHVQRLYVDDEEFDLAKEVVVVVDSVESLFGHLMKPASSV